jgi:tetratricopeptide (TPR) repeat protein
MIAGFEHAGDSRDRSAPRPNFEPIEPLEHAWKSNKSYVTATDLLNAAVVMARPELAVTPSEWLLSRNHKIPIDVKETARRILTPTDFLATERLTGKNLEIGVQVARTVIASNRQDLATYPRSASKWLDSSMGHAVLGNRGKALACMRVALSIEPNNRIVLRAAVRLLIHLGRTDEAFELLRRHPRTQSDPWLLSQDITVAHILGRDPLFIKHSRRLLNEHSLHPGHLSELASAVGTYESGTIDLKHARKLHRFSLIEPTDNVLAQIEWLRHRDSSLPTSASQKTRGAMEAHFWQAMLAGDWTPALNAALEWQIDEPYSTRPAMAGSFLASSIIGNYGIAGEFANYGLRADPTDCLLMNNLVVVKARENKVAEATSLFAKIRPDDRLHTFVYRATQGLLKYAHGDESGGADDYASAIKMASGSDSVLMVRSSWLDTQARWANTIDEELLRCVNVDSAKPGSRVAQGVAQAAVKHVGITRPSRQSTASPPRSGKSIVPSS